MESEGVSLQVEYPEGMNDITKLTIVLGIEALGKGSLCGSKGSIKTCFSTSYKAR
jgi:hypothetical protein